MTKTHWKATMDLDWIGAYTLPEGKPINVTLVSVKNERVKVRGREGIHKVARFAKNKYFDRPMLIGAKVNMKRLERLIGSEYFEDWANININVTLCREMDLKYGGKKGEKDWALRFAEQAPTLPKLNPKSEKWADAKKAFKAGNVTKEQIKSNYDITDKDMEALGA
jgi:hypothetical protein